MIDQPDDIFIKLLNQHAAIAHKIARGYCTDVDDRSDLFQEMMYQLWRSYPGFDNRSKFSTWMYRVCLNTALTYKRKSNQYKTETLSVKHNHIAEEASSTMEENIQFLFDAIATLSAVNKAVILLYLDDLSYEEIASITGLTKSNVSVRLVRTKKELESILKHNINPS